MPYWIEYAALGAAGLLGWFGCLIYLFRIRSSQIDLLQEVNDKLPYVMRYDAYSMNPLTPFRVWRQHKFLFPEGIGTRHRIKRYWAMCAASFLLVATVVSVILFAHR